MSAQQNRTKAATQTGLFLLVVGAILVVVNILSINSNKRWDKTENERYTLSKGSGRLISDLKEPVVVDAYVTRGLARLEVFVSDLNSLLKEYERAGDFQFTLIEAKTEELKERAKEAGLEPLTFAAQAETGDDQAAIATGYLGLVLKYGSEKEVIPLNPSQSAGLEFLITNKLRELRDKAEKVKRKVGVLTGKDELKLSDANLVERRGQGGPTIEGVLNQYFPFYEFVQVDLKDGATEVDASLVGLILTQPQKDYTDAELKRIDEFLLLGNKSLAVFASAANLKAGDAKMSAELNLHNLDKLLSGYGLGLKNNVLLDFGAQFQAPIVTAMGLSAVRYPAVAHIVDDPRLEGDKRTLDTGFAAFFRMPEIAFPYPSSIELLRNKQPADVKLEAVARTTPNTTEITSKTADLSLRSKGWEPKPPFGQHVVAAYAEGKLKSAFAPENPAVASTPSRVLLIASNEFITNPFAYSGNGPDLGGQFAMMGGVGGDRQLLSIAGSYAQRYLTNTILSVKNTLDWMTGDADLLAISAKIINEPNLKYSSIEPANIAVDATEEDIKRIEQEFKDQRKQMQFQITWTLTLLIPLLFAGLGLLRWKLRLDKRNALKIA
jgi:ABC-type uncharacterized transport system involved in gliding motility auxiliary subunit